MLNKFDAKKSFPGLGFPGIKSMQSSNYSYYQEMLVKTKYTVFRQS